MLSILKEMIPSWSAFLSDSSFDESKLVIQPMTGGITNVVYLLQYGDNDRLIVRLYGCSTELFINRDVENIIFSSLSKQNRAPTYYGIFNNGRIEGYISARMLTPELMYEASIYPRIATALGLFHSQHIDELDRATVMLWDKINSFFTVALDVMATNSALREKAASYNISVANMQVEMDHMMKKISDLSEYIKSRGKGTDAYEAGAAFALDISLCHNDLLCGNILLDNSIPTPDSSAALTEIQTDGITFIDFEYTDYNYRGFDIANHFCEYSGFDFDIKNKFPSKSSRIDFIRYYLRACASSELVVQECASFYEGFDDVLCYFALASHLYWGTWAIAQAGVSSIDFDYLFYGKQRYEGFEHHKRLFLLNKFDFL